VTEADESSAARGERARSFGSIAAHYDRFRPAPPPAVVEWLLAPGTRRALDVGAGTGALTRLLVAAVPEVAAVEPDRRMSAVLATRAPGIAVLTATAEALPVATATFDAVLVSSAWHWMDPVAAGAEAARVLAPGGIFGILGGGPDRAVPWVAEVLGPGGQRTRRDPHAVELPDPAAFDEPERHEVRWKMPVAPDDLVRLAGTYSRVVALPDATRAELLDRVVATVAGHPELAGRTVVELPMRCRAWRARRR